MTDLDARHVLAGTLVLPHVDIILKIEDAARAGRALTAREVLVVIEAMLEQQ